MAFAMMGRRPEPQYTISWDYAATVEERQADAEWLGRMLGRAVHVGDTVRVEETDYSAYERRKDVRRRAAE